MLISNWTRDLTIFTNGISGLTKEQALKLGNRNIRIEEGEIENLEHHNGNLHRIILTNGRSIPISAMYTQTRFEQHCTIPESLGCSLTDEGYISVDPMQRTSVGGVFACGDNTTRMRTLANAVAMGTTAGMIVNKELVLEEF